MTEPEKIDFEPIEIPKVRRDYWGLVKIVVAVAAVGGAGWAWSAGYRPPFLANDQQPAFELVEIERGDINLIVLETGTVDSANNRTIRCQVEAFWARWAAVKGPGSPVGVLGEWAGRPAGKVGRQAVGPPALRLLRRLQRRRRPPRARLIDDGHRWQRNQIHRYHNHKHGFRRYRRVRHREHRDVDHVVDDGEEAGDPEFHLRSAQVCPASARRHEKSGRSG